VRPVVVPYIPDVTDWKADEERQQAIHDLPVEPYIGLTLRDAQSRAAGEGRSLRVLESLDGPRQLDLVLVRLNVELDSAGRVVGADAG